MRQLALALFFVLAGCGGSAVPASHVTGPSGELRTVEGSNRWSSAGTVWVGSGLTALGFDVGPGANQFSKRRVIREIGMPKRPDGGRNSLEDMTIGPDGTVYALVNLCRGGTVCTEDASYRWRLKVYAPGANGSAPIERRITGAGHGRSVSLNRGSIDVLSSDGTVAAPHGYITSYAYGTGNDPAPIRTLTLSYAPRYFGLDGSGLMYVGSGSSIFVYPASSQGNAPAPARTITLPYVLDDAFAVRPPGGVYVPLHPGTGLDRTTVIDVYRPGSNGPPEGSIVIQGFWTHGIAVDANRKVYVGMGYDYPRVYSLQTGSTVLGYIPMPDFDPTTFNIGYGPEAPFLNDTIAIGPP
jgi:hypothetical protein